MRPTPYTTAARPTAWPRSHRKQDESAAVLVPRTEDPIQDIDEVCPPEEGMTEQLPLSNEDSRIVPETPTALAVFFQTV